MYSNDLVFLSINNGSSLNAYLFSSNDVYNIYITKHCCPFFEDFFVNHSLNKLKKKINEMSSNTRFCRPLCLL